MTSEPPPGDGFGSRGSIACPCEPISESVEGRTISKSRGVGDQRRGASRHPAGVVAEIRLAPAMPPSGFLHRHARKLWELTHRRQVSGGSLLVTDDALIVNAPAAFRGRL